MFNETVSLLKKAGKTNIHVDRDTGITWKTPPEKSIVLNDEDILNLENAVEELLALAKTDQKDHLEIFTIKAIIKYYKEK